MKGPIKKSGISPTVTWRKVKAEAVVLNLGTSVYYSVNQTGTFIWKLLAEGRPEGEIVSLLAEEYGISAGEAAADTADFLKAVSGLGLTGKR